MLFRSLENVERKIFILSSSLCLKNVLVLGSAGQQDKKRFSPWFTKEYASKKYDNYDSLQRGNLKYSEFLVFSYGAGDKENRVFEEVYVSHSHFWEVVDAFVELGKFIDKTEDLFVEKNGELFINRDHEKKYTKVKLPSGDKSKYIKAYPAVISKKDSEEERGVFIEVNGVENIAQVDLQTFSAVVRFLKNFNLSLHSALLLNFAAMTEIESRLSSGGHASQDGGSGGSGGRLSGRVTTPRRKVAPVEVDETTAEEEVFAPEQEATPAEKTARKKKTAEPEGDANDEEAVIKPKKKKKAADTTADEGIEF